MTNPHSIPDRPVALPATVNSLRGPLLIAITLFMMLIWSWGTWPDPLIDFGTQLYIPWQLGQGKVLYRDIAYYNGPLSQYLNVIWFAIGGVGLRTLVWANLAILCLAMFIIYRLAIRASGPLAATTTGIAFALLFAFTQGVGIGNFNWVAPYTNEITHGAVLGLLTIACISRFQRSNQRRWLTTGGVVLGLTFLTKAEPFAAAALATVVQLTGGLWMRRARPRDWVGTFAIYGACAVLMPLIAMGLLASAMPWRMAAVGVAGSWSWALNSQITALPFYRRVQGFDDVAGNLASLAWWTMGYIVVLIPAGMIALRTRHQKKRLVSAFLFLLVGLPLAWRFFEIDWNSMIRPLPIFLLIALVVTAVPIIRRRVIDDRSSLRIALVVFSLVLLIKVVLSPHIYHYGFVLAMPGTLILVAALAQDVPQWIDRSGGCGGVLRAAALAAGLAGTAATLYVDGKFFSTKRWTIGDGPDSFRGATRALEVQKMAELIHQLIPSQGTVEVFPAGLMLNYLDRRAGPTRYINFMPPEVLAAGEDQVLTALAGHPPDAIVINSSAVRDEQFALDSDYLYGRDTFSWIQKHYDPVATSELPEPYPTFLRLVLMRRKAAK